MNSAHSSAPPPLSPLAFTRDYQQYCSKGSGIPFRDTRLLQAARFWDANTAALDNPAYATYWLEDIPPLLATLNPDQLDDLRPAELEEVAEFVEQVEQLGIARPSVGAYCNTPLHTETATSPDTVDTPLASAAIWKHAAKQWLYLGDPSRAINALRRGGHSSPVAPDELASILAECNTRDATEIPGILALQLESSHPELSRWLREFDDTWRAQRETGQASQAMCVLVEYDKTGRPSRGRLRRLEGKVEALKRDAESDEVTFHHQVRSPDDPFVGTVYASFDALRRAEGWGTAGPRYRGRFAFDRDGGETYSGDSIGLSAFAVAYGDQWGREVHRERRLIGQTVAFTGGIGPDGSIQPVSPDSLPLKVARAFHSPITHLVVPEANRKAAEAEAERLRQTHPHRRLHIIGIERPSEIIADRNIFHTEKLWVGEIAIRKAAKYSRSVKVQVPVLVVLGYLLACLIYPPLGFWFDWTPVRLELSATGFEAKNARGQTVGEFHQFPAAINVSPYEQMSPTVPAIHYAIEDLDGDGHKEILFLPLYETPSPVAVQGWMYVFRSSKKSILSLELDTVFTRPCYILHEYPGDSVMANRYDLGLSMTKVAGQPAILTIAIQQFPSRTHMKVWDAGGDLLGWFINAGGVQYRFTSGATGDGREKLAFTGYNIRLNCSALFVLPAESSFGASPPYVDPEFDLSGAKHGNQLVYVIFPPTDVGRIDLQNPYNDPMTLNQLPGNQYEMMVGEGPLSRVYYTLDSAFHVIRVAFSDQFITRRKALVSMRLLDSIPWAAYSARILENVQRWTPGGWTGDAKPR